MDGQTVGQTRQRTPVVPRARTGGTSAAGAGWDARVPQRAPERGPAPSPRRIAGLCAWAALLGFLGVAIGVRGAIAILVKAPQWYEPTLITLGLAGIALTVAAILTVQYRYIPWAFLTLASGVLLVSIVATAEAT